MNHKYNTNWVKRHQNEYYELLALQNYGCAICESQTKNLVVDHDHETGLIRGLLCCGCNVLLNRRTELWIYLAIDYLRTANNRHLID